MKKSDLNDKVKRTYEMPNNKTFIPNQLIKATDFITDTEFRLLCVYLSQVNGITLKISNYAKTLNISEKYVIKTLNSLAEKGVLRFTNSDCILELDAIKNGCAHPKKMDVDIPKNGCTHPKKMDVDIPKEMDVDITKNGCAHQIIHQETVDAVGVDDPYKTSFKTPQESPDGGRRPSEGALPDVKDIQDAATPYIGKNLDLDLGAESSGRTYEGAPASNVRNYFFNTPNTKYIKSLYKSVDIVTYEEFEICMLIGIILQLKEWGHNPKSFDELQTYFNATWITGFEITVESTFSVGFPFYDNPANSEKVKAVINNFKKTLPVKSNTSIPKPVEPSNQKQLPKSIKQMLADKYKK